MSLSLRVFVSWHPGQDILAKISAKIDMSISLYPEINDNDGVSAALSTPISMILVSETVGTGGKGSDGGTGGAEGT